MQNAVEEDWDDDWSEEDDEGIEFIYERHSAIIQAVVFK